VARAEFTKATKRAAYARSGGFCEAAGHWYGLRPGQRCYTPLSKGVEYDHLILDANSHDNSLENCRAACPSCHRYKTRKHDTPLAAKTVRQRDRDIGIKRGAGRGFDKRWRRKINGQVERRT
jgi:5-methylcytosine-specific restriction endonuclease McrA